MNTCPFYKYREIFGTSTTGIHQYKFLDTAIMDYLLTIILACITAYFTHFPFVLATILWFILGIIFHVLFGVETNTTKYLGLNC